MRRKGDREHTESRGLEDAPLLERAMSRTGLPRRLACHASGQRCRGQRFSGRWLKSMPSWRRLVRANFATGSSRAYIC